MAILYVKSRAYWRDVHTGGRSSMLRPKYPDLQSLPEQRCQAATRTAIWNPEPWPRSVFRKTSGSSETSCLSPLSPLGSSSATAPRRSPPRLLSASLRAVPSRSSTAYSSSSSSLAAAQVPWPIWLRYIRPPEVNITGRRSWRQRGCVELW